MWLTTHSLLPRRWIVFQELLQCDRRMVCLLLCNKRCSWPTHGHSRIQLNLERAAGATYCCMSCMRTTSDVHHFQATNHWPVLCHGLAILLAGLSVSRGVATIEPVNKVIVPVLLVIVVFCFYWAIFLPHAAEGIIYIFTPSFGKNNFSWLLNFSYCWISYAASLKSSKLWLDAISQNAWDTGR